MIEVRVADITTLATDAIVNAANSSLRGGGGVDGAIHRKAGIQLTEAARVLAPCDVGNAVITSGFRLPARFVIHAVGPVWRGGGHSEALALRRTYESCFQVASGHGGIRSIAFPAISTGAFNFPKQRAAEIALEVMHAYEFEFDQIIACLYDQSSAQPYRDLESNQMGGR